MKDWLVVGKFGRPHGVKGNISVISFTEPRDNIMGYVDWYVRFHEVWQPIQLQELKMTTKLILAQVEGFECREDVARLTNREIAIERCQLSKLPPGEYYWHQLIGMKVCDVQGTVLGVVTEMMSTGTHDVLKIEGEKRHLIPYLPGRTVMNVDDVEGLMTVDWDWDF